MEEKKVREAIEAFQGQVDWLKRIDDKGCEESRRCCIEYFETAIEALEKQIAKKPETQLIVTWMYGCQKKVQKGNCGQNRFRWIMERLTERKYGEIVSVKREETGISCSSFCNNCSQGTGNCKYVKEMVEKLAEYEDLVEDSDETV